MNNCTVGELSPNDRQTAETETLDKKDERKH